ncbi:hypothetical protein EBR57_04420 [bacterium]|nr:hypothetical protein [bacterium]
MTRFLKKLQSIAPFLSIIGLSIVHALLLNPWVFASEMWAEMATNYYAFSESHSWAIKTLSLDSGYYPLPMRAISLGVSLFNVPSQTIPLVYNLIAVVLTGSIVGLFTLPIFRHMVQSDWLRWLTSVVILIICDWETRTFINFPYFGIWICGMLITVSLLKKTDAPPRWGWVFPILMMSKPHYLALMPATIIAAIKTKTKWRWLMISSIALQVIQCVVIAISASNGVMRPVTEATPFLVKIKALFWHALGYIGAFGLGPRWQGLSPVALVIIGLIITGGSLGAILYSKRASRAAKTMIGIGLSIVILTFAMNTILLSHQWPINATQFTRIELYRSC